MDDERSGRGAQWLPSGRLFEGIWSTDRPQRGTAMEPDGALTLATFNGKIFLNEETWNKGKRVPIGRVSEGGPPPPPPGSGAPPAWKGRVELDDGTAVDGEFRGLRPYGRATLMERGGATRVEEYDGERTIAEDPVPESKKASSTTHRRHGVYALICGKMLPPQSFFRGLLATLPPQSFFLCTNLIC